MALLADDEFGAAVELFHLLLPLRHGLEFVVARLLAFLVVLFAEDEHDHVGVLLDGA